jgi:hypothetical protein
MIELRFRVPVPLEFVFLLKTDPVILDPYDLRNHPIGFNLA